MLPVLLFETDPTLPHATIISVVKHVTRDLLRHLKGLSCFSVSSTFTWSPVILPGSSADKESDCNPGDLGAIPGSRSSPGEGTGYPLQHSWASLVFSW